MADLEHRTEIRRAGSTTPLLLAVAVLVAVVAFVLVARRDGDEAATPPEPEPRTTVAPPSTLPRRMATVHVVADTGAGPRPATTARGPDDGPGGAGFEALQAVPVLTDDRIVVLVDGGTLLSGRPGATFEPVVLDAPAGLLVASNEPGHVWVRTPADELALVALDGADPPVRLPLGGDRVVGPAAFGVVTVSDSGRASWRRPSFDPTPIDLPAGHAPLDAGGDLVLVAGSPGRDRARQLEVWSVADGTLVRAFGPTAAGRPAVLATDGTAVALPRPEGWAVLDARTGAELGLLPGAPDPPVWIGDRRFAVLVDGRVEVSDGTQLAPPWRLRALAERSP